MTTTTSAPTTSATASGGDLVASAKALQPLLREHAAVG